MKTEFVVGIDVDDRVFNNERARRQIKELVSPSNVVLVDIKKPMYGKVCRIWSKLGQHSSNDYIVLLGDDIILLDQDWQGQVEDMFLSIHESTGLPFGVGCVAITDDTFAGFPTFPVVHRQHIDSFIDFFLSHLSTKAGTLTSMNCIADSTPLDLSRLGSRIL